jgi:hypothetical protein
VTGLSVDILTLDIVVIVVPAEDVVTKVGMLECVGVCQVTTTSRLEFVKLVGCI